MAALTMESIALKVFYNVFIPLFALGVVVFIHELGHFLVAKLCGIKVLKFSIGFGPKICSWTRGDTEYRISWLFFGGYVKFLGDELEEEKRPEQGAYYSASPFTRTLVCLAGPGMNLVLGLLIYTVIFFTGRPVLKDEKTTVIGSLTPEYPAQLAGLREGDRIVEIDGRKVSSWKDVIQSIALSSSEVIHLEFERGGNLNSVEVSPKMDPEKGLRLIGIGRLEEIRVGHVVGGSPAEKAGLQQGDIITGFASQPAYQWEKLTRLLQENKDAEAALEVQRDGQKLELTVRPQWDEQQERYVIGFARALDIVYEHTNPFKAVADDIRQIFDTLYALFARTVSPKGLAGPVGILVVMGQFAKIGLIYFLGLIALISINLGVFNLLPIPVLDGGHIMFNTIEMVRRKALSKKTLLIVQNIFVTALIAFILFVTYQDLLRLGSGLFSGRDRARQEYTP